MKKVTIYLDETVWRAFRIACLQQGISASQSIEQWIRAHLEHGPQPPKRKET